VGVGGGVGARRAGTKGEVAAGWAGEGAVVAGGAEEVVASEAFPLAPDSVVGVCGLVGAGGTAA
jgi:hypothetical protein